MMQVLPVIPTFAELVQFAKSSHNVEFQTLFQEKRFHVFVKDDELYFRPIGSVERRARATRVNEVLAKLRATASWKPGDYSDHSFNASYLLSLIRAWLSSEPGTLNEFPAKLTQSMLNEEEKEALKDAVRAAIRHRDCKLREDRLVHGFQVDLRPAIRNRWIGSVYWSENNPGNDVELAFDTARLALVPEEATLLTRWFQSTALQLQSCQPRNHSGDNAAWYRVGLRFSNALELFSRLAKQTSPFTPDRERWALDNLPTPPARSDAGQPPTAIGPEEGSLDHMLAMAKQACGQSGEVRTTVSRTKAFLFENDPEFLRYISELLTQQKNRCAITNLPLQFVGSCEDEERLASLDRINSDGHYARQNLQVVCRFINRWKNDDADQNFRRLIGLLRP
jgi:hypothetical protein